MPRTDPDALAAPADWQRLDLWLWCARVMRQRSDCAAFVSGGLLRINRQPTVKPHARVRVGDVITLPLRGSVRVLKVLALAERRGPAAEAQHLYRIIAEDPLAGSDLNTGGIPCEPSESAAYPAT